MAITHCSASTAGPVRLHSPRSSVRRRRTGPSPARSGPTSALKTCRSRSTGARRLTRLVLPGQEADPRPTLTQVLFGGPDLLLFLVLALGGALLVGNVLALVRPPERPREG